MPRITDHKNNKHNASTERVKQFVQLLSNLIFIIVCHVLGVSLEYQPKAGQCQAICCDGAGGELTVERVCTPAEKCEGIESDEKQEAEHCPGESKGTCPNTCVDKGELYRFVCLQPRTG